jgi:hypothetical protein
MQLFAQILHTKPFHFSPYFLSRATIWFAPNAVAPGLQPFDFFAEKTGEFAPWRPLEGPPQLVPGTSLADTPNHRSVCSPEAS